MIKSIKATPPMDLSTMDRLTEKLEQSIVTTIHHAEQPGAECLQEEAQKLKDGK